MSNEVKAVLFVGDNRVGKTICTNATVELMNSTKCNTVKLSFADEVRQEIVDHYGIPSSIIHNLHINKNEYCLRLSDYDYKEEIPALWKKHKIIKRLAEFDDLVISLRDLFVNHATVIRRAQDPLYWTKSFKKKLATYPNLDFVIVDDCRYENELACFMKPTVFWLDNQQNNPQDQTQDACRAMCNAHKDEFIKLDVPIPLLQYNASKMCLKLIREYIQPSGKRNS